MIVEKNWRLRKECASFSLLAEAKGIQNTTELVNSWSVFFNVELKTLVYLLYFPETKQLGSHPSEAL